MPTLVLHGARNAFTPVELGRYLAGHIPHAFYGEIATADAAMWGEGADDYLDRIEDFTTGQRTSSAVRVLATILFSDIVASTEHAMKLGDRAWRALLDAHDQMLRAELTRYGGREINTTGDGFIASFESPTQAVACGRAIVQAATQMQLPLRVGIHTGECERRGADLAGIAVHIAARINAIAEPNEILVSRTVVDLTGGSGIYFDARGDYELKGVPGTVSVFAATTPSPA
jgi:class 3 adenylate cyclase